jgi:hypothetical protein
VYVYDLDTSFVCCHGCVDALKVQNFRLDVHIIET